MLPQSLQVHCSWGLRLPGGRVPFSLSQPNTCPPGLCCKLTGCWSDGEFGVGPGMKVGECSLIRRGFLHCFEARLEDTLIRGGLAFCIDPRGEGFLDVLTQLSPSQISESWSFPTRALIWRPRFAEVEGNLLWTLSHLYLIPGPVSQLFNPLATGDLSVFLCFQGGALAFCSS